MENVSQFQEEQPNCSKTETPTLREVFLAQPLNPLVPLVFVVVPTREVVNATD